MILHKNFVIIIIVNKEKVIIIMVMNLLTNDDFVRIDSYRAQHVYATHSAGNFCGSDELLRHWDSAKSQYLQNLFKNELIITKPITFKEDYWQISDRLDSILWGDERIKKFMIDIIETYEARAGDCGWSDEKSVESRIVTSLFNSYNLARNEIDSHEFGTSYVLPINDTTLRIQKGMKPMRVISKIAQGYGIGITPDEDGVSDFEYFRRKHSLALNQKTLHGDLCLSIHPMDYMTMSDNDEGWSSCMSWMEDGEYKQGTVEMMNSPCVVVGYLSSERELSWGAERNDKWNSKKWRCLFIVDPKFIISIRQYPYDNDNLVCEAIKELAKLSGWGDVEPAQYEIGTNATINEQEVNLEFYTAAMYCDFGRGALHYLVVNPSNDCDLYDNYGYSGVSQCMWCGNTCYPDIGEEQGCDMLACSICHPNAYCYDCDERYSSDELYTTDDGVALCEYCYNNCTCTEILSGKTYYKHNTISFFLSYHPTEFRRDYDYEYRIDSEAIGSDEWYEYFTIDDFRKSETRCVWMEPEKYVLMSDLTEKGRKLLGFTTQADVDEFLEQDEND